MTSCDAGARTGDAGPTSDFGEIADIAKPPFHGFICINSRWPLHFRLANHTRVPAFPSIRVEQVPFSGPSVSLAEAIASVGGSNQAIGDPAAIFVFRYQAKPDGTGEKPVVYHLDMMKAGAYFLSQRADRTTDVGQSRAHG